jgi:hypothetical protein
MWTVDQAASSSIVRPTDAFVETLLRVLVGSGRVHAHDA